MSVTDIMVGPVVLWYAPVGETLPDADAVAFGVAWGGNWTEVASTTKAPLSMSYESGEEDIEVEEALAPVRRHRVSEKLVLETTLAEITCANLEAATGESAGAQAADATHVALEYISGGGRVELTERAWGFEGMYVDASGDRFPVRFFIYKATAKLNGKLEFGKKGFPGIGFQVSALADLTQSVGSNLFKFEKVTADKTA